MLVDALCQSMHFVGRCVSLAVFICKKRLEEMRLANCIRKALANDSSNYEEIDLIISAENHPALSNRFEVDLSAKKVDLSLGVDQALKSVDTNSIIQYDTV